MLVCPKILGMLVFFHDIRQVLFIYYFKKRVKP